MTKITKARTPVDGTLADAVSAFYSAAQELRDEMQEAFDNTPESLQSSDVGQAREEAASALDNFAEDEPEVPEHAEAISCSWTENRLRKASRSDRRQSAVNAAAAAVEALELRISEIESDLEEEDSEEDEGLKTELEELRDHLQAHLDEAEAVEFPGMYG